MNFITSQNGKTFFYTTPFPCSGERYYFGIDSIGNPVFKDSNNNSIYFYKKTYIEEDSNNALSYETIPGLVKINGDTNPNKQYYIAIGKPRSNTEIFDFDNYEKEIKMIRLLNIEYLTEVYLGNLIDFEEDDKHYYIVGQIVFENSNFFFVLLKFNLYDDNGKIYCRSEYTQYYPCFDSKITYCYFLNQNKNIILCLYLSTDLSFKFIYFDTNLNYKFNETLLIQNFHNYFKFFPYEDNLYFLTHFKIDNGNNYIQIQIIEIRISESSSFLVDIKNQILLDKYSINNYILLIDILLIREKLLCLVSTNDNKEVLIIALHYFSY
jgi:hypothetical protein